MSLLTPETDLTPIPDVRHTSQVLRDVVASACAQPSESTLLFVADVIADRLLEFQELVDERTAWVDEYVALVPDAHERAGYRDRLHSENAARELTRVVRDCQAQIMEFLS